MYHWMSRRGLGIWWQNAKLQYPDIFKKNKQDKITAGKKHVKVLPQQPRADASGVLHENITSCSKVQVIDQWEVRTEFPVILQNECPFSCSELGTLIDGSWIDTHNEWFQWK